MSVRFSLFWLFVGMAASPIFAADQRAYLDLSLNQAIEMAKIQNERMKVSDQKIERIHQQYREIRAQALPQISGAISWNRYFQAPKITLPGENGAPSTQYPIKRDYDFSAQASLSQVLWAFGKVQNAIEAADRAIQVEVFSKRATTNEIIFQTRSAYYNVLLADQALHIVQASQRHTLENRDEVRNRFRGGRVSRFDHVKMEADVASRSPIVLDAENASWLAMNTLKAILGLHPEVELSLSDGFSNEFSTLNEAVLKSALLDRNPILLTLKESMALQDHIVTQNQRNYFPTLTGVAAYSYGGDGDDFYIGNSNMFPTLLAGVMLTFPIWDSGVISGRYRQALADRKILDLELTQVQREMLVELNSMVFEHSTLLRALDANQKTVDLASQAYQLAKASALAGKASQTEVNDAELRWTQAQLALKHTLYRLHAVQARVEYLVSQRNMS